MFNNDDILRVIGRSDKLFEQDFKNRIEDITTAINESSFLVIGGAGSIGSAVVREIFKLSPKLLHVIDIDENSLAELVRDLRSTIGYIGGEFGVYSIDCGSLEFSSLLDNSPAYDYVLNLSALKHVRSESDPYTLMRMIDVNILNVRAMLSRIDNSENCTKYFCVSTDKAANPASMMGASKRIMEYFLALYSSKIDISSARFANVAFSNGSLLKAFEERLRKRQPISAPSDIRRYFITENEAAKLCVLSALFGRGGDIYCPKQSQGLHLTLFTDIANRFLDFNGFQSFECESEEHARSELYSLVDKGYWPCYFFSSDTSGEKPFEEFYTDDEEVDLEKYLEICIVKNKEVVSGDSCDKFLDDVTSLKDRGHWSRAELIDLFSRTVPSFAHVETGKSLNERM